MKQRAFLLLFAMWLCCTATFAFDPINNSENNSKEKKLAVEGRTWWYKSDRRVIQETQEYGIRIGEEVTINQETWNKVSVCMFTEPHTLEVDTCAVSDTILIGYIKDDGRNVSSIAVYNSKIPTALEAYMIFSQDFESPTNLYTFGLIGELGSYGVKNENLTSTYTISEIAEISNSGISYLEYHCTPLDNGYLTGRYDFIEGIGHPTNFVLFPHGGGNFNMIGWEQP